MMNNETIFSILKLSDFPYLHPSLLEKFGAVYAPDMGVSELKCCQKYYLRHRRAPKSPEELAFLNAFVATHYRTPDSFLISEMMTEDAFLAETFADVMAKRAAVSPDYKMPCSFAEITEIAQKYLAAHQKNTSALDMLDFSCEKHHTLSLSSKKVAPTILDGSEAYGLSAGKKPSHALVCHTPLAAGDRIYAFLKSTDLTEDFEEKLSAFASSSLAVSHTKWACAVGDDGILDALMHLKTGFELEFARLYGEETPALRLLAKDVGLLLVAKNDKAADLLMAALDLGLRPRFAGILRKDEQLLLTQNKDTCFQFSLHFLKTLSFSRAYHIEMNANAPAATMLSLSDRTVGNVGRHNLCLSCAKGDDSRHAALYAAIHTVASLTARGADLDCIQIAHRFDLALTKGTAEPLGKQLALLLGLYRAIAELELCTLCSTMLATEQPASSFTIYAVAPEPEKTVPDTVSDTESHIYLLEPLYDEMGTPDFENLRNLLAYVNHLQKSGDVLSAKAVFGDVLPALESMSGTTPVEYLPQMPYIAKAGSILIESKKNIHGTLLAHTCKPVEENATQSNQNAAFFPEQEGKAQ